jgi:hypothetical protein
MANVAIRTALNVTWRLESAMTHGGKRQGAGRPKGSRNKASSRREQFVALGGRTPIEVMLDAMRRHHRVAEQEDRKNHPNRHLANSAWAAAVDAAHKAAPYVHPRLTVIDHNARFNWDVLTKQEVDFVEPILRKALDHGVGGTVNGEAAPVIDYNKDGA